MNQEPLGVAPTIVVPASLQKWSDTSPTPYLTDYSVVGEAPRHAVSPFPCNPEINRKIILW